MVQSAYTTSAIENNLNINIQGNANTSTYSTTQEVSDNSTKIATTAFVKNNLSFALPTGTVLPFAGSVVPDGFLLCNGSVVSRTTYADLFAVIGTSYGSGDGSTTFNLPNFTSRFLAGNGLGYADESLPSHTHSGTTGNESAGHTHSRGSMDITGTFTIAHGVNGGASGAFSQSDGGSSVWGYNMGGNASVNTFKASNSWSGNTSNQSTNHTHSFTTGNPSSSVYVNNGAVRPLTTYTNMIIKY